MEEGVTENIRRRKKEKLEQVEKEWLNWRDERAT